MTTVYLVTRRTEGMRGFEILAAFSKLEDADRYKANYDNEHRTKACTSSCFPLMCDVTALAVDAPPVLASPGESCGYAVTRRVRALETFYCGHPDRRKMFPKIICRTGECPLDKRNA
jgi:hypothetical protein